MADPKKQDAPSFQPTTLCPILTAAVFARPVAIETGKIAVIGAQPGIPDRRGEPDAIACQGPACAWFIVQADEKGNVVGGRCAAAMGVVAAGMLHSAITDATSKLIPDPNQKKS